jgi:hypothetical protein
MHQGNLAHGIHTTPQRSYYLWRVTHYHTRNMGVHGSAPDGGDNCLTWLLCHSETATSINLIALLLNLICHPAHYTVLQYSEFWSQITMGLNPKYDTGYRLCEDFHCYKSSHCLQIFIFNLLKPTGNFTYHKVYHPEILHCNHMECVCFIWISENTAILPFTTLKFGCYNWGGEYLLRGMDWVLIWHR